MAVDVLAMTSPAGSGSGEPRLSETDDGLLLSWLEQAGDGSHELRFAHLDGSAWSEAMPIVGSDRFFVNWADFPSVSAAPDGSLWAHWLARGSQGGYDYSVQVARSLDGGGTWTDPWTLHEDASPTEHGFVSTVRTGDRLGFTWLDGRKYVPAADGSPATEEMSLYFRDVGPDGAPGAEMLVDGRVCDCCQTAAALTSDGPLVVYRDRTEAEVRDIYVARMVDGSWTEGRPVSNDGWVIGGCPVNGPAVVASERSVAVAWFTAPNDEARVKVAFSSDAGATFEAPVVVDDGNPGGRVDLVMMDDGSVVVSWLERTGGEGAEVRIRRVRPDGSASASASVTHSSAERASGFPQLARDAAGLVMAWTDVAPEQPVVRVARIQFRTEQD